MSWLYGWPWNSKKAWHKVKKFFFDTNVTPKICRALRELDSQSEIAHLNEVFDPGTADTECISALARDGHEVVLTADLQIFKNPHERRAWQETDLCIFTLTKGYTKLAFWEQAVLLIRLWPDVKKRAARAKPREIYELPLRGGNIKKIS